MVVLDDDREDLKVTFNLAVLGYEKINNLSHEL